MHNHARPFYSLGGINAETYDIRTETPPGEIEFYVQHARTSGGPVLEIACGTGRVTWPIARAGVPIVGLDLEQAMLDQAEQKRAHEDANASMNARFVQGDMTNFALGEQFALAIIPFRAFLLLRSIEQQRAALRRIHAHLRPGGALIIDIFDPLYDSLVKKEHIPPREFPAMRHPRTGNAVEILVLARTNDQVHQSFVECWRFREIAADGRVVREEEELLELRWIFRYEMQYLLELTGFVVESEVSDYLGAPPAYGKEQIWIASRA
jgi:SAM-dependent methyltransferase